MVLVFVGGFFVGRSTSPAPGAASRAESLDVTFHADPNFLSAFRAGDRAECLQWVSNHFTGATAGMLGMICAGTPL